jgi:hypothetical protein
MFFFSSSLFFFCFILYGLGLELTAETESFRQLVVHPVWGVGLPRGVCPHTGQQKHRKEADMNARLLTMAVYEQSQTLHTIDHM